MINCCPYCGCCHSDLRPTSRVGVSMRPHGPRVLTPRGSGIVVGDAVSCEDGKIRNFLMVKLDCGKTEPFSHDKVTEDNYCAPSSRCISSSEIQPEKGYSFSCTHPEGKFQVGESVKLPSGQEAQVLGFHVRWVISTPKGWWSTQVVMEYRGGSDPGKIIAHHDYIVDKCCHACCIPSLRCFPSEIQPEKGFSFSCVHPKRKFQVGELIQLPSDQEAWVLGFHIRKMDTPIDGRSWWWTYVVVRYEGGPHPGWVIAHDDCIVDKCCPHATLDTCIPPCRCPYFQPVCWVPEDQEFLQGERRDYYHTLCANVKEIEIPYKGYTVLVVQYGTYYEIVGIVSRRHYRLSWDQSVSEIVLLPWKEINEIKRQAGLLDCHGYVHYWGKE